MDKLTGEWKNLYNGKIIKYTLSPNQKNPAFDNITPLHLLITRATENQDDPQFIDLLNSAITIPGVNINVQDGKGRTPLYLAIELENYGIANGLLNLGADITIPNNDGISPLVLAAIQSSEDEAPEKNLLLNKLIEQARPIENERLNEHWDKFTEDVRKKITNAGFKSKKERATAEAKLDCRAFLAKHGISTETEEASKKDFRKWSLRHHPNKGEENRWLFPLVSSCMDQLKEEEEAKIKGETVEEAREREAQERVEEEEAAVAKEAEEEREARERAARELREARERVASEARAARERAAREAREAEEVAAAAAAGELAAALNAEEAEEVVEEAEQRAARKQQENAAAAAEAAAQRAARKQQENAAAAEAERAARKQQENVAAAAQRAARKQQENAAAAAERAARKQQENAAAAAGNKSTTHKEKLEEIKRETDKEVSNLLAEIDKLRKEMNQFKKQDAKKIPVHTDLPTTVNAIRRVREVQRNELNKLIHLIDSIIQENDELRQINVNAEKRWNQELKTKIERDIQSGKIGDCLKKLDILGGAYTAMQQQQRRYWEAKQEYGISPRQKKIYQEKILYYRGQMVEIAELMIKVIKVCQMVQRIGEWIAILEKDRKAFLIEQENLQDFGGEGDASLETKQRLQTESRTLALRFESDIRKFSTLPELKDYEDENSRQLQIIVEVLDTLHVVSEKDLPEDIEKSINSLIEQQTKISGFFLADIDLPIDKQAQKKQVLEAATRFLNRVPAEPLEEDLAVSREVMINSILLELNNPARNDEAIAQLIGRVFSTNKDGINTIIDKKGNTLLILTILYRLPEAILKLVELGATINIQNEDGLTALMLAIAVTNPLNIREKGALRVITRLLENASLDVNLDSKDNNDAYEYATRLHSRIRSDRDKQVFKEKVLDKLWAKRATRARIAARRAAKGALGAVKGFFTIPDFNILGDM